MKKRIFSFVLALALVFGILPLSVFANEEETTEPQPKTYEECDAPVEIINGEYSFKINKTAFDVGEPILITASGPNSKDWVGVYEWNKSSSRSWKYVDGIGDGVEVSLSTFAGNLPEGEYVIRLQANDSSNFVDSKATVKIKVGNPETGMRGDASVLSVDKKVYEVGEPIMVSAKYVNSDSWVGLYQFDQYGMGRSACSSFAWINNPDKASGEVNMGEDTPFDITSTLKAGWSLPCGVYYIAYFPNGPTNFDTVLASTTILIDGDTVASYDSIAPSEYWGESGGEGGGTVTPDPEEPTPDPEEPNPENPDVGGGNEGTDPDTPEQGEGDETVKPTDGPVTITNGEYELSINKTMFEAGEPILVSGKGPLDNDWIGLYRVQDNASIMYQYLGNVGSGAWFDITENYVKGGMYNQYSSLPEGEYVIRLQANGKDGYEGHRALVRITIGSPEATVFGDSTLLSVEKQTYKAGEPIMVTPHMTPDSTDSWVGVYGFDAFGKGKSHVWEWVSTNGDGVAYDATEGMSLPEGIYMICLIPHDAGDHSTKVAYTMVTVGEDTVDTYDNYAPAQKNVTVSNGTHSMSVNKTRFEVGEEILVTATAVGSKDWIGIARRDDREGAIRWYYVIGTAGNGVEYNIKNAPNIGGNLSAYADIPEGLYTIYLVENDKYLKDTYTFSINISVGDIEDDANGATDGGTTSGGAGSVDGVVAPEGAEYTPSGNGYAGGTVTVNMPNEALSNYNIVMFWADENGPLDGYTLLARVKVYSSVVTHTFTKSTIIPKGAKSLIIYSENRTTGELSEEFVRVDLPQNSAFGDLGTPNTSFFAISDVHIGSTYGATHFKLMLKEAIALYPNGAPIYVSGDIADHGYESEYNQVLTLFDEVMTETGADGSKYPIYVAIGNHDYPSATGAFLNFATLPDGTHPSDTCYDFWLNGYHYIFLGSDTPSGLNAYFNEQTLAWLDEKLAENRNEARPTFVFLHQGIYNTVAGTLPGEGWHGITNEAEFVEVIKKYPEVVMFNGHSHWELESRGNIFEGTSDLPIRAFNCASVSYLWTGFNKTSGENRYGSQGYAIDVYDGKVVVRGRDFVNSEWVSGAQYCIEFESSCEHDYDKVAIKYEGGFDNSGKITFKCSICSLEKSEECEKMLTSIGYSVRTDDGNGFGLSGGYMINQSLRALYETLNETKLDFGIIVLNPEYVTADSFMLGGIITSTERALQVSISETSLSIVNVMIRGIDEKTVDLDLIISAYIIEKKNDEIIDTSFYQAETSAEVVSLVKADATLYSVSYNSTAPTLTE